MTISISSGATPVELRFSRSFSCVSKIFLRFSSSLLPIPVSIRMFWLPVRTSTELQLTVMRLRASALTFLSHRTFGMMPKKAPPSATYVPSEMAVSSKSPRVREWFCTALIRCSQQLASEMLADASKKVDARSRPGDAVGLAREELQIKLLSRGNECIDHLHGVLHVH